MAGDVAWLPGDGGYRAAPPAASGWSSEAFVGVALDTGVSEPPGLGEAEESFCCEDEIGDSAGVCTCKVPPPTPREPFPA